MVKHLLVSKDSEANILITVMLYIYISFRIIQQVIEEYGYASFIILVSKDNEANILIIVLLSIERERERVKGAYLLLIIYVCWNKSVMMASF